jgi:pimeloyl-ACP methyl ester carboxylesterase
MMPMSQPETKYAKSDGVSIAYQVTGQGPLDLVFVPGWVSHLEYAWEDPSLNHFYHRLASFSRLIRLDKRGTGLSDRVSELPTLEQRMDDVRAVMDAVGSERAAVFGTSEGGPMCALLAATYPERTSALVLYGTYAKRIWDPEYPWAPTPGERQKFLTAIETGWGGVVDLATLAPSMVADEHFKQWWAAYLRLGASPGAALALAKMNTEIDIRHILATISVPTLILHRRDDRDAKLQGGQYIAERIPKAKFVELPGQDHLAWVGDADAILGEVEEFLTGVRHAPEYDRVLATVLFSDIVGSTERAAELGDRRWRDLLDSFHALVRRQLERHRGRELDTAGDGVLAAFDGPARAIRCACAVKNEVRDLGIEIRAGLHTGECERVGSKLSGIAVHIGARIASQASASEVLVSSTVKDLVAGSGLRFEDRGAHVLKGVPGEWRLFAVTSDDGHRAVTR